jgi:hypothetical protein
LIYRCHRQLCVDGRILQGEKERNIEDRRGDINRGKKRAIHHIPGR